MQYHTAMADNADCIVTRNKDDFTTTKIPVLFFATLSQQILNMRNLNQLSFINCHKFGCKGMQNN